MRGASRSVPRRRYGAVGCGCRRPWAEGIARARRAHPSVRHAEGGGGGGLGCPAQDGARAWQTRGPPTPRPQGPRGRSTQREQGRHRLAGGTSRHHSSGDAGLSTDSEPRQPTPDAAAVALAKVAHRLDMVYSCAEPRGMLDWMRPSVKQPTRPRLSSQDPNNGDTAAPSRQDGARQRPWRGAASRVPERCVDDVRARL